MIPRIVASSIPNEEIIEQLAENFDLFHLELLKFYLEGHVDYLKEDLENVRNENLIVYETEYTY